MAAKFWPLEDGFVVTSPFGPRWGSLHAGTDFGKDGGSANLPVYAVKGGTVIHAGAASGYGGPDPAGWLVIDHPAADGGGVSEYGHIVREVQVGQRVEAGNRIGRINPSQSTNGGVAPHLHLSVMPYEYAPAKKIDPIPWLDGARYPGPRSSVPVPPPVLVGMTAQVLSEAMGGRLPVARYAELLPGMVGAMLAAGITNVNRAAMWCAQIGHESAGLLYMEEIADGSRYEGRSDLGNTQPGDGRRFKGSGPIQLTGRHNFTAFSKWAAAQGHTDDPMLFVNRPELVRTNPAYGFLAASWYWTVARTNLNALSDARNLDGATRAINGGLNGLDDRRTRYNRCLAIGERLIPQEGNDMTPEQAAMLERIHHELTHGFRSRVVIGDDGELSEYSDTAIGYQLNTDAATYRTERAVGELADSVDKLVALLAEKGVI